MGERTVVLTADEVFHQRKQLDLPYVVRIDQGINGLVFTVTYWEHCTPEVIEEIRIWRLRHGSRQSYTRAY